MKQNKKRKKIYNQTRKSPYVKGGERPIPKKKVVKLWRDILPKSAAVI